MESISDIKQFIEEILESLKDYGDIHSYKILSGRHDDIGYFVNIEINDQPYLKIAGTGYEYDTKLKTWKNILLSLVHDGITLRLKHRDE